MTPDEQIIHTLLNEDMSSILEYCEMVSLSATEDISQSTTSNSETTRSTVGTLSPSSSKEVYDAQDSHNMESPFTGIETSPSASKHFIFELSEELLHQNKELPTLFTKRHYYSSSAHDDDSMSDISESIVSDDDTFSFRCG